MTRVGSIISKSLIAMCLPFLVTACGTSAPAAAPATQNAAASTAPSARTESRATKAVNKVDCDAVRAAVTDLGRAIPLMVSMKPDSNFEILADSTSPAYMNFSKTRTALDTLATLPDPTDPEELTYGKPSEAIAYFREMADTAEGNVKSHGSLFNDTGASGRKVIGNESSWSEKYVSFGHAIDSACQN